MSPLEITARVVQVAGVHASPIDDEMVLMNADQENYFGLNPVSRAIWEAIAAPATLDEVCLLLLARFDVDQATCQAEVLAFVQELRDANLVEVLSE
jgi:hypothetical protein